MQVKLNFTREHLHTRIRKHFILHGSGWIKLKLYFDSVFKIPLCHPYETVLHIVLLTLSASEIPADIACLFFS
jgi:hypothetical protein